MNQSINEMYSQEKVHTIKCISYINYTPSMTANDDNYYTKN